MTFTLNTYTLSKRLRWQRFLMWARAFLVVIIRMQSYNIVLDPYRPISRVVGSLLVLLVVANTYPTKSPEPKPQTTNKF